VEHPAFRKIVKHSPERSYPGCRVVVGEDEMKTSQAGEVGWTDELSDLIPPGRYVVLAQPTWPRVGKVIERYEKGFDLGGSRAAEKLEQSGEDENRREIAVVLVAVPRGQEGAA